MLRHRFAGLWVSLACDLSERAFSFQAACVTTETRHRDRRGQLGEFPAAWEPGPACGAAEAGLILFSGRLGRGESVAGMLRDVLPGVSPSVVVARRTVTGSVVRKKEVLFERVWLLPNAQGSEVLFGGVVVARCTRKEVLLVACEETVLQKVGVVSCWWAVDGNCGSGHRGRATIAVDCKIVLAGC